MHPLLLLTLSEWVTLSQKYKPLNPRLLKNKKKLLKKQKKPLLKLLKAKSLKKQNLLLLKPKISTTQRFVLMSNLKNNTLQKMWRCMTLKK